MAGKPLPLETVLELLRTSPPQFAAQTAGLSDEQLARRPDSESWSAVEMLAHLRACADVWGRAIETLLAEDHPTIKAVNPGFWVRQTDYPQQPFHASLAAFTQQRADLLAVLTALTPEQWERGATVTGAGKPLERTVRFYADWLAHHERSHWKSMAQVCKR